MKMEKTECSETSAYELQTPGNHPKESIQHSEHGESLKSRIPHVTNTFGQVFTASCRVEIRADMRLPEYGTDMHRNA